MADASQTSDELPTSVGEEKVAKDANSMRNILIDKVVLNISAGGSGDRLTKAARVLKQIANEQEPVFSKAQYTVRTFGIRRNEQIACYVTMRGEHALKILRKGLMVKEYELRQKNFSNTGNFGFGIEEHIDLGIKYDPTTGIYGMDFYIVLRRKGQRIAKRKQRKQRLGKRQKITQEDAMIWFEKVLGGHVQQRKPPRN
jgi:large subunit ribosomal protein L11e|tara:strand:- start:207 stop:803 length:597 start_codon:yes stop_codon:yes gene_type:complete